MWVYAIGHLSDNHLSCYITYHLLTCSIWSYTVTSPCPDSHGWCPTMRKLPEDKWCFMMLPHSVSTLSMCCGVSLWLNVLINTWCCVIIHVFDGQLGIYLIYAILCLCHLLDNHVKCTLFWIISQMAVFGDIVCVISMMALLWCYNVSVPLVDDPICCYTGMCHLSIVHKWLYTPSPLSFWCHVWCYAVCFHLLDNHTSWFTMSASSLWWPPITLYCICVTSPWMHIMLFYDYVLTTSAHISLHCV